MQRFLCRKLASEIPRKLSLDYYLPHSYAYKTFSPLHPPTSIPPIRSLLLTSSLTHPLHHFRPWKSQHTFSAKIRRLLSNPFLGKHFMLYLPNTHMRISSRSLADCSSYFSRLSSRINPSLNSYRRGGSSWSQMLSSMDVVLGLIVANVSIFLLWRVADPEFMKKNFTISLENFQSGRFHTLITAAFSHINIGHITYNMIGLYFFGNNIVRNFGPEFLLKLYLAGAVGGSIFYLVYNAYLAQRTSNVQGMWSMDSSKRLGLGASGAVNAIMLLDIFLFPKATLYFDFIIPVPAILLGIFLIGKDMLRIMEGNSNISGAAHLGGAAVAALTWARVRRGHF